MMIVRAALLVVVGIAFAFGGCKKEQAAAGGDEKKGGETKKEEPAASGDKIGIAECDEYLEKFGKCIPKLPEQAQAAMKKSLETTRDAWKQAVKSGTKAALQQSCKMTLETNKKTMTQCDW